MNKEPNFIASLGTNEDRLKWWQKNGIMPSERILIEQKAELKGKAQERERIIKIINQIRRPVSIPNGEIIIAIPYKEFLIEINKEKAENGR